MNILLTERIDESCWRILEEEGFHVDIRLGLNSKELAEAIGDYHGLIVRSGTKVTADQIGAARSLKVIGRAGTGVDNIDVQAATRKGILVMNTPGGNTTSAAEHTVSMLLALARHIPQAHMSLISGEWERKKFIGVEVLEKTIGLVGLGKIGREVAVRCQGLGMNVIGYDPILGADVAAKLKIELVDLNELYRRSDFISVHTPLTQETRSLLNDETLSRCKRGVRLVNCARGGIIDESALARGLESGQVAAAALDVFETEPPGDNVLLHHPNVIVTPHLGASTEEAQEKVAMQIARQMSDALKGRGYAGVVNGSVLQSTLKAEINPYISLAEKLGRLAAQTAPGHLKKIVIALRGETVADSTDVLQASVLCGILGGRGVDHVNLINSSIIASDMGIAVVRQSEPVGRDIPNLLRVTYQTDRSVRTVAGTVFGNATIRLVEIDGFRIEAEPSGSLMLYCNVDKPGILAAVSALLAKQQVNIAGVSLGRTAVGAKALTLMNLDGAVPEIVANQIRQINGVTEVHFAQL